LSLALIGIAGFLAQLIDGTLGMGYGVTSATLLISIGVLPSIASASVHTSEVFVSFVSGASHFRLGNVNKNLFIPLTVFGIIGGAFGAYGLVNLPITLVKIIVGSVLSVMGIIIIYRFVRKHKSTAKISNKKYSTNKLAILGFFAAFIDAIGGGGWGPVCTPTLVISGTDPKKAIGSVNLAEVFVSLAITITFILLIGLESFRWDLVVLLLVSGFIAAPIAAFACKKLPHKIVGTLVGVSVMSLSVRMLLSAFGLI
jgi:uncharacterized membrane protein YfcA